MLKLNKNFKLRWILANTGSALVGGTIWFALYNIYRYSLTSPFSVYFSGYTESVLAAWLTPLIVATVTGITLSLTTMLVLRPYIRNLSWWKWLLVNTFGVIGGLGAVGLFSLICALGPSIMNFSALGTRLAIIWSSETTIGAGILLAMFVSMFATLFGAITGIVIGVAQAIVLRRYIRDTWSWPFVTAFALGCAGAVGGVFFWWVIGVISTLTGNISEPSPWAILSWGLIGAIYGMISAGGLRSLFEDAPYKYPAEYETKKAIE
jgi:hypothetical protein